MIIYIHNWSLQPFTQDYGPGFSHHLCVLILYMSGFTKFSWKFYLLSEFLLHICWEEVTAELFFVYFHFDD